MQPENIAEPDERGWSVLERVLSRRAHLPVSQLDFKPFLIGRR